MPSFFPGFLIPMTAFNRREGFYGHPLLRAGAAGQRRRRGLCLRPGNRALFRRARRDGLRRGRLFSGGARRAVPLSGRAPVRRRADRPSRPVCVALRRARRRGLHGAVFPALRRHGRRDAGGLRGAVRAGLADPPGLCRRFFHHAAAGRLARRARSARAGGSRRGALRADARSARPPAVSAGGRGLLFPGGAARPGAPRRAGRGALCRAERRHDGGRAADAAPASRCSSCSSACC